MPVVVVCPEFRPGRTHRVAGRRRSPSSPRAAHVEFVNIDSGHWPMVTRGAELARIIDDSATASLAERR